MTPRQTESARQADQLRMETGHSEWFYVQRGETYGPVSSTDLCAAAHLGFLGPDDMVRRSDKTEWVTARSVHGLFQNRD